MRSPLPNKALFHWKSFKFIDISKFNLSLGFYETCALLESVSCKASL